MMVLPHLSSPIFFFNDTATTEIYTLSLHDALPISSDYEQNLRKHGSKWETMMHATETVDASLLLDSCFDVKHGDRKSTRLNSSHQIISYAVFCLKKKKNSWAFELAT